VAGRDGASRIQYLAGGASDVKQERTGRRGGVWEATGCGASSIVCSEGLYIGQGVGDKGGQKVACAGALVVCKGHAGHGGLGGVLEGCCLSGGVLWVGAGEVAMVGDV
jgi:hypothetical protein